MYIILTTIFVDGVGLLWIFDHNYRGLFLIGVGLFCAIPFHYAASPEAVLKKQKVVCEDLPTRRLVRIRMIIFSPASGEAGQSSKEKRGLFQ